MGGADAFISLHIYLLFFMLRPSRSTNTLTPEQPVSSMLLLMSWSFPNPVNSWLVNWQP